jgi:hypothetical protein
MIAAHSRLYRGDGTNVGGWGFSFGMFSSGLPMIFRMIRKRFGKSVMTGRTLSATGLYFFFVWIYVARLSELTLEGEDEVLFEACRICSRLLDDDRVRFESFSIELAWVSVNNKAVEA